MERPLSTTLRTWFIAVALIVVSVSGAQVANAKKVIARGKIAFQSNQTGNNEIFVMDEDGSNKQNITINPGSDNSPDWSPDGKKVAFNSDRDTGFPEIYVMNSNGGAPTRITFVSGSNSTPAWSPDGKKIAFQSRRDGDFEIYVMNADGSQQTRLTNVVGDDLILSGLRTEQDRIQ